MWVQNYKYLILRIKPNIFLGWTKWKPRKYDRLEGKEFKVTCLAFTGGLFSLLPHTFNMQFHNLLSCSTPCTVLAASLRKRSVLPHCLRSASLVTLPIYFHCHIVLQNSSLLKLLRPLHTPESLPQPYDPGPIVKHIFLWSEKFSVSSFIEGENYFKETVVF